MNVLDEFGLWLHDHDAHASMAFVPKDNAWSVTIVNSSGSRIAQERSLPAAMADAIRQADEAGL